MRPIIWDSRKQPSCSCRALHGAGWLAVQQQDYTRGAGLLEQSLAHAREVQEPGRVAAVLQDLGHAARLQGEFRRATGFFEESVALSREVSLTQPEFAPGL